MARKRGKIGRSNGGRSVVEQDVEVARTLPLPMEMWRMGRSGTGSSLISCQAQISLPIPLKSRFANE